MFDFSDDNSIFLSDSPHEAVVGANEPVRVLYDAPFKPSTLYEEQVATTAPACSMLDIDVVRLGVVYGTPIAIRKNGSLVGTFEAAGLEPDGLGFTRITLTLTEA